MENKLAGHFIILDKMHLFYGITGEHVGVWPELQAPPSAYGVAGDLFEELSVWCSHYLKDPSELVDILTIRLVKAVLHETYHTPLHPYHTSTSASHTIYTSTSVNHTPHPHPTSVNHTPLPPQLISRVRSPPGNSACPVSNSAMKHPTDHMSTGGGGGGGAKRKDTVR